MPRSRPAVTRRTALAAGLSAIGTACLGASAIAKTQPRVVVIGGGAGGATVAGRLTEAVPNARVTLIEAQAKYASCFFSNHFIGGGLPFDKLVQSYDGLRALGVDVVTAWADGVDLGAKAVSAGGSLFQYDVLVVAPGIDFKLGDIEGLTDETFETCPHAWRGGVQAQLLRRQLEAMPDGGTVLITAPAGAYRCPPGPYERACFIADYFKREKPKSKIIILDGKFSFTKQAVFEEAYRTYYGGMLEHLLTNDIDDMGIAEIDAASRTVVTKSGERFTGDVVNIVPPQRAGVIAHKGGIAKGDWCPVDVATFQSTASSDVFVLGDSAIAGAMPKSAYSANNQAVVVVEAIAARFASRPMAHVSFKNTCWSFLAPNDSVKIGGTYLPGKKKGQQTLVTDTSFVSQPSEKPDVRRATYDESFVWFDELVKDVFRQ